MTEMGMSQDVLVQKAEALISQLKASKWDESVGRTQASKALEVAQDAQTLRLFVNWLRYQAARESERQPFWSVELGRGREKANLAKALTRELNAIQEAQPKDPMPAVRLFLGYFRRALVGVEFLDDIKVEG